jgi:hypothetical protein
LKILEDTTTIAPTLYGPLLTTRKEKLELLNTVTLPQISIFSLSRDSTSDLRKMGSRKTETTFKYSYSSNSVLASVTIAQHYSPIAVR